ncbi:MAG: DUF4446 family protein [Bacillota bacterium]|nr:DUF4446 family protein [Bacillota bacterium]
MSFLSELVTWQSRFALLGLVALAGVGAVLLVVQSVRLNRLMADYRALMTGVEGEDLHAAIQKHLKEVRALARRVSNLEKLGEKLTWEGATHLQRVGLVRYNAFPDMGSNQSFSLALLDAGGNGIVLTSLYGRSESRIFAKPILAGKSEYTLSEEEKEAIRQATTALPEPTRSREEMAAAEEPALAKNRKVRTRTGARQKKAPARQEGGLLAEEGKKEERKEER